MLAESCHRAEAIYYIWVNDYLEKHLSIWTDNAHNKTMNASHVSAVLVIGSMQQFVIQSILYLS